MNKITRMIAIEQARDVAQDIHKAAASTCDDANCENRAECEKQDEEIAAAAATLIAAVDGFADVLGFELKSEEEIAAAKESKGDGMDAILESVRDAIKEKGRI